MRKFGFLLLAAMAVVFAFGCVDSRGQDQADWDNEHGDDTSDDDTDILYCRPDFDMDGYVQRGRVAWDGDKCPEGWDTAPNDFVDSARVDCDDYNRFVHPGADEVCDGLDNNCDGDADEYGDALCSDGKFCNGAELCDGEAGCQPAQYEPCPEPLRCSEGYDQCRLPDD